MLPQRNVVSVDHKSSRRRWAGSNAATSGGGGGGGGSSNSSSNAAGRRIMIKITRNPFFNFRTLVRHRVGAATATAGRNAVAISTMAGREWSALDEQQKRPYRRLAHLSKMNGGPFFVHLEHLRTFLRYPECVHNNEFFARIRTSGGAARRSSAAGGSGRKQDRRSRPLSPERDEGSEAAVRSEGVSPQPDANFGGYEVAPAGKNCDRPYV